jgi:glutamyl-tRNA reductase
MKKLVVLGISHKTAPVEWREKFALPDEKLAALLDAAVNSGALEEAVALSTCNRVEIYGAARDAARARDALIDSLARAAGADKNFPRDSFYFHSDQAALGQIFRVAAGLDSLVVGESEILGQVKRAYEFSRGQNRTGKLTNVIFQRALFLGKRVRSDNSFSWGALSVPGLAVSLAQRIFGDLAKSHVLLVGAGEMAELAAHHFASLKVPRLSVVNRTLSKAADLAKQFNGAAFPFDKLPEQIVGADIILFSTAAPEPILAREQLSGLMEQRKHRSLFLIDIGVPRNVDPACHKLENVYLYNVDDLQALVAENAAKRQKTVGGVEALLQSHVAEFSAWYAAWQKGETSSLRHAAGEPALSRDL